MADPGQCEFCGQDVAVGDAVIYGPKPKTDDEWDDLARRFMRREPELELVFLHRGCDFAPCSTRSMSLSPLSRG
jgi:hypothetical protein